MNNKKGARTAQNRDETGVAQQVQNLAVENAAANDPGFAKAFNKAGIIERPGFSKHHYGADNHSDASLFAHKVGGQWLGGFAYAIRSGACAGETMLPSVFDGRYGTRKRALADAASRLLASLQAKYPDTGRLNNTEAALVKKLRAWAQRFLPAEPAAEAESLPLAGKRFIDLFSGIGGFRLALEELGAECVLTCEIDKAARQTYAANFSTEGHPFPGDITRLSAGDVPDHDILVGGFPCQAFSTAGLRKGFADRRGKLFFEIARIVQEKLPALVILENVGNFLKLGNGKYARAAESVLAGLGYAVSHKTLKASDFGLPQNRERVFYVAIRRDCIKTATSFAFPLGTGCTLTVADLIEADVPAGRIGHDDITPDLTRDPRRPIKLIGRIRNLHQQTARVLSPDGIGPTLVTTKNGGGLYLIDGKARALTPRERARMMGFPDSYMLDNRITHACKQLGNSVAVPVVKAVALAAANDICFKPFQPVVAAANDAHLGESSPDGATGQKPKRLRKVKAPARKKDENSYLPWAGAKTWSRAVIEPHLPPFRKRALFPFGGVASDALGYADIFDELQIADINDDLVNAHRWITRNPEAAIRSLAPLFRKTGDANQTYLLRREAFNKMKRGTPKRARMFIYLLRHGWRGNCSYNRKGGFNTSFSYRKSFNLPVEAIRRFAAVLGKARFHHADMLSTLSLAGQGDVVFLDPPYRPKPGAKEQIQYTAKGFPVSTYREMVTAVEAAVRRGATVFAHDHLTRETLGLHPHATEILPVEVTRAFHKSGKVLEAIFIYRPRQVPSIRDGSKVAMANLQAANQPSFHPPRLERRVSGSDCVYAENASRTHHQITTR